MILVTSPVRLSTSEESRLVGAFRYWTSRPTTSESGRQMTGNIHRFAVTKGFSQIALLSTLNSRNHSNTKTLPNSATTAAWM